MEVPPTTIRIAPSASLYDARGRQNFRESPNRTLPNLVIFTVLRAIRLHFHHLFSELFGVAFALYHC